MTAKEYFKDWVKVIDNSELIRVMNWLKTVDSRTLCPEPKNIFKAFLKCPYEDCKVVFLGQDPYPQEGVATGILFGNKKTTTEEGLSPSLKVVKEAAINYDIPHESIIFDNTLESWAKQGILMINTAFTCEVNNVGSHYNIWKNFVSKLLYNIGTLNPGLVYVLFGNQASSFKKYIQNPGCIIESYHPAFYARKNMKMPSEIFTKINEELKKQYNIKFKFYESI